MSDLFPSQTPAQLIQGDCVVELGRLGAETVQSVIADPPYFNVLEESWDLQWKSPAEYLEWTHQWVTEAMRILRPDGLLFCFGQLGKREHTFLHLMAELTKRWSFHDLITWDRVVGYNERRDSFTPATELILVLRKSDTVKFHKDAVREPYDEETILKYAKDKRYQDPEARMSHLRRGKFATNLWRIPSLKGTSKEKAGHPSQKPIKLIERLILCATDPDDLVVDPFAGSGTTALVAARLGRRCVTVEVDATYCEMIRKRLAKG